MRSVIAIVFVVMVTAIDIDGDIGDRTAARTDAALPPQLILNPGSTADYAREADLHGGARHRSLAWRTSVGSLVFRHDTGRDHRALSTGLCRRQHQRRWRQDLGRQEHVVRRPRHR